VSSRASFLPPGILAPPSVAAALGSMGAHTRRSISVSKFVPCREGGGEGSARAHTCVALGRCVAFGRPKMSVWGHAGADSPSSKVAIPRFAHPYLEPI
jgi:hypothetical protein